MKKRLKVIYNFCESYTIDINDNFLESKNRKPIIFKSNDTKVTVSSPLHQKFVCKDKLNITLENKEYKPFILELLPEIDMQPMNTGSGFGSNGRFIHSFA